MTRDSRVPFADSQFHSLLRAAKRGDNAAWSTLYHWLAPQILGFLRTARLVDAEDVVGEVFHDAARNIGAFKGDATGFRAWVFTIARARRIDEIRRTTRRATDSLDTNVRESLASGIDVEGEAIQSLVLDDLLAHLRVLTDDQAEVIVLRTVADLSAREIAEITERSVGAVEQLQHRALRTLRESFDLT